MEHENSSVLDSEREDGPRLDAAPLDSSGEFEDGSQEKNGEEEEGCGRKDPGGKQHGTSNYLPESLARHVRKAHELSPAEYRSEVLARTLAEWPQPVTAQVLRSRLTAYKDRQCDASYAMGSCASCARRKRACKLQSVVFPTEDADRPPDWLGYSSDDWLTHRERWYAQVDELLCTERYLDVYFQANRRVLEADKELVDVRNGIAVEGLCDVRDAQAWCHRVRLWRENLRVALWDDAVPAPGHPERRWLLFAPEHRASCSEEEAPVISCSLCKMCWTAFRLRGERGAPAVEMPFLCRARGLWGGPEPEEIRVLSYVERRVINLARVFTAVKTVRRGHNTWMHRCPDATPQYTTRNVVAYPQDPDKVLRAVSLLPEELCGVLAIQFVGSDPAVVGRESALMVSVARLRAAFWWLGTNNWTWMLATKGHGMRFAHDLGKTLENVLDLYGASVQGAEEAVPEELLRAATGVPEKHAPRTSVGPADAVADSEEECDDDAATSVVNAAFGQSPSGSNGENPGVGDEAGPAVSRAASGRKCRTEGDDCSAAILDTGLDDLLPLRLWTMAIKQAKVLEDCQAVYENAGRDGADKDDVAQAQRDEAVAIAQAVHALQGLATKEVRQKLDEFHRQGENFAVRLPHGTKLLNSFDEDYWAVCFVDLFYRGDCRERYSQHTKQVRGRTWIKLLLKRADFAGWAMCKEFAACTFNVLLRRSQMYALHTYVNTSPNFAITAQALEGLTPMDWIASALAAGECYSTLEALRKKGVSASVKRVLRGIDVAMRDVEGSEAERRTFRYQFVAMRLWGGCSSLFFTLNPHDIKAPMLVVFSNPGFVRMERVSLDWGDETMDAYYERHKKDNPFCFHTLAVEDPAAAALCVHETFRMVIEILFNCAPPANVKPEKQHLDTFPCKCEPGIFGHVAGYFGPVEPQMRQTEHIHMLVQLLGFSHPRELFEGKNFVEMFRRVWGYCASICFRSQEGFAAHCGTPEAMEALKRAPLIPVTQKQAEMIGSLRTKQCVEAQLRARGLEHALPAEEIETTNFRYWTPAPYGDRSLTAAEWGAFACRDSNAGCLKCGNHVCRSDVCHKKRRGAVASPYCRMFYWHYMRGLDRNKRPVAKKVHGRELVDRWNCQGLPPVHSAPPQTGLPALEQNHPFHFKMNPAVMLGPRCNHDVGVLLRLLLPRSLQERMRRQSTEGTPACLDVVASETTSFEASMWEDSMDAFLEALIDHEFYCSDYASKDSVGQKGGLASNENPRAARPSVPWLS